MVFLKLKHHLEGLLKLQLLHSILIVSGLSTSGDGSWEFAFLAKSKVMVLLLLLRQRLRSSMGNMSVVVKNTGFDVWKIWIWTRALPLTSFLTSGKFFTVLFISKGEMVYFIVTSIKQVLMWLKAYRIVPGRLQACNKCWCLIIKNSWCMK